MRERSNKPLLYVQRLRSIAIEVFKMYHNIGPSYLHDFIVKKSSTYQLRMVKPIQPPGFKSVTYGFNSFKYQGSCLWNSLSNDFKNCTDLKTFKSLMSDWQGHTCMCSCCKLCILKQL